MEILYSIVEVTLYLGEDILDSVSSLSFSLNLFLILFIVFYLFFRISFYGEVLERHARCVEVE